MEPLPSLERKVKLLERSFRGMPNVQLKVESLKGAYLQALLSRGDRRCSSLLAEMATGVSLKKAAKIRVIDTDDLVYRTITRDEVLPWELIGTADKELPQKDLIGRLKGMGIALELHRKILEDGKG